MSVHRSNLCVLLWLGVASVRLDELPVKGEGGRLANVGDIAKGLHASPVKGRQLFVCWPCDGEHTHGPELWCGS